MKRLSLLLLSVGVIATASAQVQFGVKAGANFATVTGSDVSGAKMKVGFNGGAFAAIPFASQFSVQPEVLYSGQGAKSSDDGDDFTLNENYLNVPVLVKYNHPSGFFLEAGPQIGFLLSANAKSGGESVDVKSSYKSTDFSVAMGLGYLVKSVNVGIDARYTLGLSNISAGSQGSSVKNNVIQVGLFYLFGGKAAGK